MWQKLSHKMVLIQITLYSCDERKKENVVFIKKYLLSLPQAKDIGAQKKLTWC
jgi:hypothetical protein